MKTVLIIDDDLMAQEIISEWLMEKYKVQVLLASNVGEGLLVLKNDIVDFVICDYLMPDGNGKEILNFLKESNRDSHFIPIIMFSGSLDLQLLPAFPLIAVINDKDYDNLFGILERHQCFR
ncbi:MAG: response regulator [Bacteriovorax sp.]